MYPLYESSCSFSFSFFSSNFNNGRSGTREEMEDKIKLNENLKNLKVWLNADDKISFLKDYWFRKQNGLQLAVITFQSRFFIFSEKKN